MPFYKAVVTIYSSDIETAEEEIFSWLGEHPDKIEEVVE